jgi:hypothetical protein
MSNSSASAEEGERGDEVMQILYENSSHRATVGLLSHQDAGRRLDAGTIG